MEWLAGLAPTVRNEVMYDDMCHLKVVLSLNQNICLSPCLQQVACNKVRSDRNEISTFFAERKMCVDFLHFKLVYVRTGCLQIILKNFRGHKTSDKYCQRETNPRHHPELVPVNSVVCEQAFNFTNHYSNLKAMNGPRYNFFWIYILDLHNNYVEDPRVVKVNPLSPIRMSSILEKVLRDAMKDMKMK